MFLLLIFATFDGTLLHAERTFPTYAACRAVAQTYRGTEGASCTALEKAR